MKTVFLFAKNQLMRVFRDPVTLIVLFAIPVLLLVLFGAFTRGTDDIKLRVAIVNSSSEGFAKQFEEQLKKVETFKQPSTPPPSIDEARQQMRNDELDSIIELPAEFGHSVNEVPTGSARVYFDQTDTATGDIVSSIMNNIVLETNKQVTGVEMPLSIERTPISGSGVRIFDSLYAMFTSMAIMMVGVFGVASTLASDKKTGILRRLRATPLRSSQLLIGVGMAFAVVAFLAVALMTVLALTVFGLEMKGSWLVLAGLVALAIIVMLGFGLAIAGWSKNSTQADIYGQIVFIASLAFSGLWFPRALMPEWLQSITSFLPLTPIIDGMRAIITEGATFAALGFEIAVLSGWIVAIFLIGIKTFRWE